MEQVHNRENTMRKFTPNSQLRRYKEKGMHIELHNDLTLQMEIDYGELK